jgi:hypothetical protein
MHNHVFFFIHFLFICLLFVPFPPFEYAMSLFFSSSKNCYMNIHSHLDNTCNYPNILCIHICFALINIWRTLDCSYMTVIYSNCLNLQWFFKRWAHARSDNVFESTTSIGECRASSITNRGYRGLTISWSNSLYLKKMRSKHDQTQLFCRCFSFKDAGVSRFNDFRVLHFISRNSVFTCTIDYSKVTLLTLAKGI